jgi:predicted permease
MLYRFGATTPIAQLMDVRVALTYLACALTMVTFCIAVTRHGRIGWNDAAFGALVAAFPNTGFMGVPLLVALLGAKAAGPAIVTIVVDMVITSSLCIALSRLNAGQGASASRAARNALKGVATNPMPWAILGGALASALQITLPKPGAATLGMLADAATPVALFTIGAVLARSQIQAVTDAAHAAVWGEVLPVAALKLFVHPILVLAVGSAAIYCGVALDRFALTVLVLVAALPSASNVSMLAERFGADNGRIARIIMVTTALAFVTFSAAVAWMTA